MTRLLYVCEGGDCSEKGSGDLYDSLKEVFDERDPHEEKVRLRRYPCFGGCECGINVTVFPDREFYSEVTKADLPAIVAHVLDGGDAVTKLTGKVKPDVEQMVWEMLDSPY